MKNKYVVQTTGPFMLQDITTATSIEADRPTLVEVTSFIHSRIALGQLECFPQEFPMDATNVEFQVFLSNSDGDADLAVASYLATFSDEAEVDPTKTRKKRGPGGSRGSRGERE